MNYSDGLQSIISSLMSTSSLRWEKVGFVKLCYNKCVSALHIVNRVINGIHYRCQDTGCDDFDRAAQNRSMIVNERNITGYQWVEAVVRGWPHNKPLPSWIPQGDLPKVGKSKEERQELRDYDFKVIDNWYDKWRQI